MAQFVIAYHENHPYVIKNARSNFVHKVYQSKSECIRDAQQLNGFVPVDGDEQTYARQVAEENS
jgi:hypothetical protein